MHKKNDFTKYLLSRREFMKISGITAGGLAFGSLVAMPSRAAKDIYPEDRINFIVPHGAGGGFDIYGRSLAPYLTKYLKEISPGATGGDVLIKNEPAAAGRKAYSQIFNAKPDGYTIGGIDASVITDSILEKPPVDYSKFTFLFRTDVTTQVILTSMNGFRSWTEVVNEMKKGPVKMSVTSFGRTNHIAALITNETMGTRFRPIPFGGPAESLGALLRGDVKTSLIAENAALSLIEGKQVRVLLRFSDVSEYPGAANTKQLGFPDLAERMGLQRFMIAPPGLEADKKKILVEAIRRATNDPAFIAWAKTAKIHLASVAGSEAEKIFADQAKYYMNIAPLLREQLKRE